MMVFRLYGGFRWPPSPAKIGDSVRQGCETIEKHYRLSSAVGNAVGQVDSRIFRQNH